MVPSFHSDAETRFTPVQRWFSSDSTPVQSISIDTHTIELPVSPLVSVGDGSTSALPVLVLRIASIWEATLIAVLLLAVSALLTFRITELVSNGRFDVSRISIRRGTPDDGDVTEDSTIATRPYESVLSADTPPELLSDEGRIVRLLVENDGRTYQYQIVEATGWSKSKVSRTLSRMHDEGTIEKVSVGRENVIVLSDERSNGDGDDARLDHGSALSYTEP